MRNGLILRGMFRVGSLLLIFVALQPGMAIAQVISQEAKLLASAAAGANSGASVSIRRYRRGRCTFENNSKVPRIVSAR